MNTATITSAHEMQSQLKAILAGVVPDFELGLKAELAAEINRLKREKNAVILGHNYMEPEKDRAVAVASRLLAGLKHYRRGRARIEAQISRRACSHLCQHIR